MRTLNLFTFLLALWVYHGYGVTFTQGPEATLQNGKINVSFTVSASTDVEVAIINLEGKIVRHLAAGVLGGQYPPPAPLASGLSQSLDWDGFDDYYRSATGGPFKARVRLGIKPEFERSINTKIFAGSGYTYGPGGVNPTEDFLYPAHPLLSSDADPIVSIHARPPNLDITVNDVTDEIFFKVFMYSASNLARVDGLTGNLIGTPFSLSSAMGGTWHWWGEPVLSWDGQYIFYSDAGSAGKLFRFTLNGQPAPWPSTGQYSVAGFPATDIHTRGHAGAPDGSVYILHYSNIHEERDWETGPFGLSRVKDGSTIQDELVVIDGSVSGGVKVGPKGNIYIAARVKPKGQAVPPYLEGKLSGSYEDAAGTSLAWWGDEMYGSILKFGPSGGSVRVTKGSHYDGPGDGNLIAGAGRSPVSGERSPAKAEGLIWMYYGYSHVMTHNSWRGKCWCSTTRFDIDRFGRLFFPNTFEYEVIAIDNSRNEIFRFKNRDVPEVAIGLGQQVQVTDRAIYIADYWNNQIVCFNLAAEDEATVALPVHIEEGAMVSAGHMLFGNYPNPFTRATAIRYAIPNKHAGKDIILTVYDAKGKQVQILMNKKMDAGAYSIVWDGSHASGKAAGPGVYVCRLKFGSMTKIRKMLLVR